MTKKLTQKEFNFNAEFDVISYAKALKSLSKYNQFSGGLRKSFDRKRKFIVQSQYMIANAKRREMFCICCDKVSDSYEHSHIISDKNWKSENLTGESTNWFNMIFLCKSCNYNMAETNMKDFFGTSNRYKIALELASIEATNEQKEDAIYQVLKNHWIEAKNEIEMECVKMTDLDF